MDWKDYELEIEALFRQDYPTAQVTHNAMVAGKFSKVDRQIDILIEETASDFTFRIVIDAKHRGRKIDVADVEAFIGLTRDVEAHTGMLVALEGYTPAAVNRAHNDDIDIILDVLSLDELKEFQGHAAIAYSGKYGVSIASPFGWIIDRTKRPDMLATLYQRGRTFEESLESNEWMYISFWKKLGNEIPDLETLLEFQRTYMLEGSKDDKIEIIERSQNQREGARTLIRRFKKSSYPAIEYAGFVDFPDFILMCVLFTPEALARKNLRKLRFVLRDSFPMSVSYKTETSPEDSDTLESPAPDCE